MQCRTSQPQYAGRFAIKLKTQTAAILVLLSAFIAPLSASAADLLPGAYVTAPAGTTINALFYFYSERDKQYLHGQRVLNHPHLDSGIWVGKFSHYFKLGENTANLALILPAGSLHGGKDTLALGRAVGATMTQDPSYQFQTFLRYHFSPAFDVASGVSYVWGGETQVNGIRKYNAARTSKLVLFGGYMFGRGRNWPRAINVICR